MRRWSSTEGGNVEAPAPAGNFEDTMIGLSFSGGGMRASAFAYGVLRELSRTEIASEGRKSTLIDQVDLVSSVSGGSVTAAYFALKGSAMLNDYRKKFLSQNVEENLRTSVSLTNLVRLSSDAALNDSTGLQVLAGRASVRRRDLSRRVRARPAAPADQRLRHL